MLALGIIPNAVLLVVALALRKAGVSGIERVKPMQGELEWIKS